MINIIVGSVYSVIKGLDSVSTPIASFPLRHELQDSTWEAYKSFPFPVGKYEACRFDAQGDMYLLTGLVPLVMKALKNNNHKFSVKLTYESLQLEKQEISEFLYNHQKLMGNNSLKNKRGINKAATGAGKTYAIAEVAWHILQSGGKVLITVPTIGLLSQFQLEFKEFEQLSGKTFPEIGLIGDGNFDLSKELTFAIPDTIASRLKQIIKNPNRTHALIDFLASIDALLSDECHTAANLTYSILLHYTYNKTYSLAWSATPYKEDGSHLLLTGAFGNLITVISEQDMMEANIIMTPRIYFKKAPAAYAPPKLLAKSYDNKTYNMLYDYLIVKNQGRNNLIASYAKYLINEKQGPTIIIVKKIDKAVVSHGKLIRDILLQNNIDLPLLHGGLRKASKNELFEALRDYSIPGVIAGPSILKLGINIPKLFGIVLGGAGSSSADVLQRIGRVLRHGLAPPVVIDFMDQQSFFKGQSNKRYLAMEQAYGKENITIQD